MSDKVRETSSKAALKELKEDYLRMLEDSFQNTNEIKKGDVVSDGDKMLNTDRAENQNCLQSCILPPGKCGRLCFCQYLK